MKAEKLLGQLVDDYGENPDVASAVDEIRPLLAMCKVKRGDFAVALELIDLSLKNPKLPPPAREELAFWRGICLLHTSEIPAAQEQFGAYYADTSHDRTRRFEAFLLFGTGYIQLDDHTAAADFFADQIPKLPPDQKEVAGRARVLLLHSLTESGRSAEALELIRATFPTLPEMTQVVSFQLLTLQLGARFLEEEKYYQAITCLNRLWPRERLIGHQHARQAEWQARRALLKKEGAKREALVFQIDGVLTRIARELEQFEKLESYDAARQLRLAQAFMGLGRWQEAGALLEASVTTLPPDKLLQDAAATELESWQQIPRWDKVLDATGRYPTRFQVGSEEPEIPAFRLARAEALHGLNRTEEAEREFGNLAQSWPKHRLAPRAFFMGGICQLELDRPEAAFATFQTFPDKFPQSALRADALYWKAMALTFQKQWPAARAAFADYLKKHPAGPSAADATLERARCLHNQFLHPAAAGELTDFLAAHPDSPRRSEALLLLGESRMAMGEMDAGMTALRDIPESEERLHTEAQFKIGEALQRLDRPAAARDHFAAYIAAHPRSLRLAEAVLEQGRSAAKAGDPDAARTLYWDTLEKLGDDPANQGVEDLLLATRRLYPGADGIAKLMEKLDGLQRAAAAAGRKTMAVRTLWARGHLLRESAPDAARAVFMQLGPLLDPALHHARILADCADARREAGAPRTARDLYLALQKWHPRSLEKERASYGLGLLALADGQKEEALTWFDRCARETVGGTCGGDAMIEQALLLAAGGKAGEARELLEKVTTNRLSQHRQKARALLELGRLALAQQDPVLAARHFERCYLSGAKFGEFASQAWLEHGRLLEAAQKPAEAAALYQDFLTKRAYASLPAASLIRERLKTLSPPAAP